MTHDSTGARVPVIVHKFGGSSLASAERFAGVADIILQHRCQGDSEGRFSTVLIVSAMSGVTDQLIAGARAAAEGRDSVCRDVRAELLSRHMEIVDAVLTRSPERLGVAGLIEDQLHEVGRFYRSIAMLGEYTARGLDAIVSLGSLLSASILAAILRERGLRALAVSATELIVTDDKFGAATPLPEPTRMRLKNQISPLLERGDLPVVTGHVAATGKGVPTTLGPGGGDYSAAIVGAALQADEVWIWSDADGILTADPSIVTHARTLDEISYAEAANLAYYGSEVLHPNTVRPLREHGIPLRIMNSLHPAHPGTRIVDPPSPDRELLPAIISATGLSLVAIGTSDDSWELPMAARALHKLSEAGVQVLMFSQAFSEHNLNLIVRARDQAHCLRTLSREFTDRAPGHAFNLEAKGQVATVSIVGVPGWNGNGIVAHSFAALGRLGTQIIAVAQAANQHSVSFCVPEEQMGDAVRFLHHVLGLERPVRA